MGGKLNVYNLGEKGVVITKSPLHHEDGEFLSTQNGEFYVEQGKGALRKRPGLQRFNTEVLAAAVKGVIGVPLPGPSERSLHVFLGTGAGNLWKVTEDNGATWADATEGFATDINQVTWSTLIHRPAVHLLGNFFWIGRAEGFNPSGTAAVFGFDGEMEYELTRFSTTATWAALLGAHNGRLIAVEDTTVWLVDPVTGERETIGSAADIATAGGGTIYAGCSYLGKVWIGLSGVGCTVLWARQGDSTWTVDHTNGPMASILAMLPYQGKLYVGYSAANPTAPLLESRTSAAVWATEQTGVVANPISGFWDNFVIHQDKLYVAYSHPGLAGIDPNYTRLFVNDAGAWSLEKNFAADFPGTFQIVGVFSIGAALYVAITDDTVTTARNGVYKKVFPGGSWTQVYSSGSISLADGGMFGVV